MLTIVIPTYNRAGKLSNSLSLLLPQLRQGIKLCILDNASSDSTPELAIKAQAEYPNLQISYVRNPVNIGANANILRAFELCDTEWVWVLGDDDIMSCDSVGVITKSIADNPSALYIEFASCLNTCPPKEEIRFNSVHDWFASEFFCFSNFLFISSGIYNATSLRPYLSYAMHYQFTFAPHVCILLIAIFQNNCKIIYSPFVLINWEKNPDQIWDYNYLGYRLNQIIQVAPTLEYRKLLHRKIQNKWNLVPELSLSFLLNLLASPCETRERIFVTSEFVYFSSMHQRLLVLLYFLRFLQKIGVGYVANVAINSYKKFTNKERFNSRPVFGRGGPLNFPGF